MSFGIAPKKRHAVFGDMSRLAEGIQRASTAAVVYNKILERHNKITRRAARFMERVQESKTMKGFKVAHQFFQGVAGAFKNVQGFFLDALGIFMQLAEASGVLAPFKAIFQAILQTIGGYALMEMKDHIIEFMDILFSPESMKLWEDLGGIIADFFIDVMHKIENILTSPNGKKLIQNFLQQLVDILFYLGDILYGFVNWIGDLGIENVARVIYGFAVGLSFLAGLMYGGIVGPILGATFATIAGIALAPLLNLQKGGYVPPRTGGTPVILAEGGEGEFVIPESKMGGLGNQELLWATESNGRKIDRLVGAIETQNRIMRLNAL